MTAPSGLPALPAGLEASVGPFAAEYARLRTTDPVLAHHTLRHAVAILGGAAPAWRDAAAAVLAAEPPETALLLEDEVLGGAAYVLAFARHALAAARAHGGGAAALRAACVAFEVAKGMGPLGARDAQDAAAAAQMYLALGSPVAAAPVAAAPKPEPAGETAADLQSMFPAIPHAGPARGAAPRAGARPLPRPGQDAAPGFPQIPKTAKKTLPPDDSDAALSALFPAIPGAKKTETPAQKPAAPAASSSTSSTSSTSRGTRGAPKTKSTDVVAQEEEKYSGARKACKFAVSALNFEDSTTAVTQILLALRELTGQDYVPQ